MANPYLEMDFDQLDDEEKRVDANLKVINTFLNNHNNQGNIEKAKPWKEQKERMILKRKQIKEARAQVPTFLTGEKEKKYLEGLKKVKKRHTGGSKRRRRKRRKTKRKKIRRSRKRRKTRRRRRK